LQNMYGLTDSPRDFRPFTGLDKGWAVRGEQSERKKMPKNFRNRSTTMKISEAHFHKQLLRNNEKLPKLGGGDSLSNLLG